MLFTLLAFGLAPLHAQDDPPQTGPLTGDLPHIVPLSAIIIDNIENFSDRELPYDRATEADIMRSRNRVRPFCLDNSQGCFMPNYESGETANEWLAPDRRVLGFLAADGQAYAFPQQILNIHALANDVLADEHVLVATCAFCDSTAIFSRQVGEQTPQFGNAGSYYDNVALLYSNLSNTLWSSVSGEGLIGDHSGERLQALPSVVTTWARWYQENPDTLVLSRHPNYVDYSQDIYTGYASRVSLGRFTFPVGDAIMQDERLDRATHVIILLDEGGARAFPLEEYGNAAIPTGLGSQEVVILSLEDGPSAAAYASTLEDGTSVDLSYDAEANAWRDSISGSLVNLSGRFYEGSLAGSQLVGVPSRYSFWFAALVSFPDIEVVYPE